MADGTCTRCDAPAEVGRRCAKHHRFMQMRCAAKHYGKTVPTEDELEAMVRPGNVCPDCDRPMVWLAGKKVVAAAVSLQHYRDGTMALVCRSCNSRHLHMPGDTYRELPDGHKRCPPCGRTLPVSEFHSNGTRLHSECRDCATVKRRLWIADNRERYNKAARDKRAALRSAST